MNDIRTYINIMEGNDLEEAVAVRDNFSDAEVELFLGRFTEMFQETPRAFVFRTEIDEFRLFKLNQTYVMFDGDTAIAFIGLIGLGNDRYPGKRVNGLGVDRRYRRRGLARKLYLHLLDTERLYADRTQTPTARALWRDLAVNKHADVYRVVDGRARKVKDLSDDEKDDLFLQRRGSSVKTPYSMWDV